MATKSATVTAVPVKKNQTIAEQMAGPQGRVQVQITVMYEDKYNETLTASFEVSKLRSLIQGSGPSAGNEAIDKFYNGLTAKGRDLVKESLVAAAS